MANFLKIFSERDSHAAVRPAYKLSANGYAKYCFPAGMVTLRLSAQGVPHWVGSSVLVIFPMRAGHTYSFRTNQLDKDFRFRIFDITDGTDKIASDFNVEFGTVASDPPTELSITETR